MSQRNPRLLWVEGKNDSAVVKNLCFRHDLPQEFEVQDRGGIEPLLEAFPVQVRARGLECFGIVVDADQDLHARWDGIRDRLVAEGYDPIPESPPAEGVILVAKDLPVFGVWIMPNNIASGALEDFAAALTPDGDSLWSHASSAIDGIPEDQRRFPPLRRAKAMIHTWLAWQESPGSPMGQAITKGDLDPHAPLADAFIAWLRRLMLGDGPADQFAPD
jgi:hypothetical protein